MIDYLLTFQSAAAPAIVPFARIFVRFGQQNSTIVPCFSEAVRYDRQPSMIIAEELYVRVCMLCTLCFVYVAGCYALQVHALFIDGNVKRKTMYTSTMKVLGILSVHRAILNILIWLFPMHLSQDTGNMFICRPSGSTETCSGWNAFVQSEHLNNFPFVFSCFVYAHFRQLADNLYLLLFGLNIFGEHYTHQSDQSEAYVRHLLFAQMFASFFFIRSPSSSLLLVCVSVFWWTWTGGFFFYAIAHFIRYIGSFSMYIGFKEIHMKRQQYEQDRIFDTKNSHFSFIALEVFFYSNII